MGILDYKTGVTYEGAWRSQEGGQQSIPIPDPTPQEYGTVQGGDSKTGGVLDMYGRWYQLAIDIASLPFKPWTALNVYSTVGSTAKETLETGDIPNTPSSWNWPDFNWPDFSNLFGDLDLSGLGESATKFGTMALVGLALVAVIMFLK